MTVYAASQGRRFGFTIATALGLLGIIALWRGRELVPAVLLSIAGALAVAALLIPSRLGPLDRGWMKLAHTLSKVTTPIFMGIVYFVVLTPIGVVRRTFGKNPIVHHPDGGSYWLARAHRDAEVARRRMERQF